MPAIYTGNPATITTPLAATVNGATNVSPIVITTNANHLYATGDRVTISGVLGNTAANGTFPIIVLSSTTFSLTGSTGSGAYVSGGTCSDLSFTPQFTIPSDGDAPTAASVNVAIQSLADRTQYLIAKQTATLVRIHMPAGLPNYQLLNGVNLPVAPFGSTGTPSSATDIVFTTGAFSFATVTTASSSAKALVCGLDSALVDGATLTLVRVRWSAPGHGALPALMPKMWITRTDLNSTTTSLLSATGLATDASGTFTAYNATHWNSLAPDQNSAIDKSTYSYSLGMFNEGGTNALVGAGAFAIEITQTVLDARRS